MNEEDSVPVLGNYWEKIEWAEFPPLVENEGEKESFQLRVVGTYDLEASQALPDPLPLPGRGGGTFFIAQIVVAVGPLPPLSRWNILGQGLLGLKMIPHTQNQFAQAAMGCGTRERVQMAGG